MRYDNILFDVMNIYYRAYSYKLPVPEKVIINNEKVDVQGVAGSIKMIMNRMKNYGTAEAVPYFLFDNAKTSLRRQDAIDPSYKDKRKKMPKSFYHGLDYLETILRNFYDNGRVIRITSAEADDLVKPVLRNVDELEYNLMVSTDLDWARSIKDNTHWLNNGDIIDKKAFLSGYGFPVTESNVIFYKTFYGDKSDNIEGALKQFPRVYFNDVIKKYTDAWNFVSDALQRKIEYLDEGWIKRIDRDRHLIYSNWELISFQDIDDIELERYTTKTSFNELRLKVLYEAMGILGVDNRIKVKRKDLMDSLLEEEKLPWKK